MKKVAKKAKENRFAKIIVVAIILISLLLVSYYFIPKYKQKEEINVKSDSTSTTLNQDIIVIEGNTVLLFSNGFNRNLIKLPIGAKLIIINKDNKTHNLNFMEIDVNYVLEPNDKLEFPITEKGKFRINDKESGSVLNLEVA
jgi:regulatory protein YycI of two-component signal transduction system YycFG